MSNSLSNNIPNIEILELCEAIAEKLGIKITCGAEIEFYCTVKLDKLPNRNSIISDLVKTVEENPELFTDYHVKDKKTTLWFETSENLETSLNNFVTSLEKDQNYNEEDINLKLFHILMGAKVRLAAFLKGIRLNNDFQQESGIYDNRNDYDNSEKEVQKQFEVTTSISTPLQTVEWIDGVKNIISEVCKDMNIESNFRSHTHSFTNPSGLHIHFGFTDKDNKNLIKDNESVLSFSAIEGILEHTQQEGIKIVLKDRTNNRRLEAVGDFPSANIPKHLDVGSYDNKDCVLRIIDNDKNNLHYEYRLSGAGAKGEDAVLLPVLGSILGIAQKICVLDEDTSGITKSWSNQKQTLDILQKIHDNITPAHQDKLFEMANAECTETHKERGTIQSLMGNSIKR